jgi:formate--tetrahydrofolate ligase
VIATKTALRLADYVVTEAGFGADLGAEKFLNIKCRNAGIWPSCAVLVVTIRGIRHHGTSLESGIINIQRHIENLRKFSLPIIVAINHRTGDLDADLKWVQDYCKSRFDVPCVVNRSWALGSHGSEELGRAVLSICETAEKKVSLLYEDHLPILEKIRKIACDLYLARDIDADASILQKLSDFEKMGFAKLPVCIAKTQYSFSTNPKELGAASDHTLKIREVRLSAGAGFIVAVCGDLMTMPGLPKIPAAESISVDSQGQINGLY